MKQGSRMAFDIRQFRDARGRRDFDALVAMSKELRVDDRIAAPSMRALARTLRELNRPAEARRFWRGLLDLDANDAEAAFSLAHAAVREGKGIEPAIAAAVPGSSQKMRLLLREALTSDVGASGSPATSQFRHVAICGVSFCGSTLFDRMLGGLPGVKSIGESHWLAKEYDGANYVAIDVFDKHQKRGPYCTVCSARCKFLTRDFRISLAVNPHRWYHTIARRLETGILVSADKNIAKLIDNDPLLRFHALILFKSPEQAWVSQRSKLPEGRDTSLYAAELSKYLDVWSSAYRSFLDAFAPADGASFLCFDEFTVSPAKFLKPLCQSIDLPCDPSVLTETRPGHAIGGNSVAMKRLREKDYMVKIEPIATADLTASERRLISEHARTQATHKDLMGKRLMANT